MCHQSSHAVNSLIQPWKCKDCCDEIESRKSVDLAYSNANLVEIDFSLVDTQVV